MNKSALHSRLMAMACVIGIGYAAAAAEDGVLTWTGPSSGGDWWTESNWTASEGKTVQGLLSGVASYNLDGLQNGAVLQNDGGIVKIWSLSVQGSAKPGTITLKGSKEFLFGTASGNAADLTWRIGTGNTLDFQLNHSNLWAGDSPKVSNRPMKLLLLGNGRLKFNPSSAFLADGLDIQPCSGSQLSVSEKCALNWTTITMWNTAQTILEGDVTVAGLTANGGTTLNLNGHNLTIAGGENSLAMSCGSLGSGKVTGAGNIIYKSGLSTSFSAADMSGWVGNLELYGAVVTVPSGLVFPAGNGMTLNGAGQVNLSSSQSLTGLSGVGATGGVNVPGGATLTLAGANGSSTEFAARIGGEGNVVKSGSGYELKLTGDNRYTGKTSIEAGTLSVSRPHYRNGLVARWTFDDVNDPGRDYGPNGFHLGSASDNNNTPESILDGLRSRGAVDFWSSASDRVSYLAVTGEVSEARGFPSGSHPVSVSMWLRPDADTGAYIYRHGNWGDGNQFVIWYLGNNKLEVSIMNWSWADGDNSPVMDCPGLTDGKWHHIVASCSPTSIKLWYDGELKRSTVPTRALTIKTTSPTFGISGLGDVGRAYRGGLDEACVWDHELTAAEVAAEYALTRPSDDAVPLPKPVCGWTFNDASAPGKDSEGNADLATYGGSVQCDSLSGAYGKSLNRQSAMQLPAASFPASFPVVGKDAFTVSVRLAYPESSLLYENHSIVRWGKNSTVTASNTYFGFSLWNAGSPRCLRIRCGNVYYQLKDAGTSASPAPGNWTHLIVTCDPATQTLAVYRDGVLEYTVNTFMCSGDVSGDMFLNIDPYAASAQTAKTNASLDDVRVFNKALTPYEVQVLSRSLEDDELHPVLSPESEVEIAEGARLNVDIEAMRLGAVSGTGVMSLLGSTSLLIGNAAEFAGTVNGGGELVVGSPIPSAKVNVDVRLASELTLAETSVSEAWVTTTKRVIVPETGRIIFPSEPKSSIEVILAKGAEICAPAGLVGWSSNLDPEKYFMKMSMVDGELRCIAGHRPGFSILVR